MDNLVTKLRLVAIEIPIKRAKIAVPSPTDPPSAAPAIKTVTSMDNLTL